MKLVFTTLGCPKWDMDTIISKAREYGFDAVDFRGYLDEINIFNLPEFTTQAGETLKKFKDAGLEISCFSSSAQLYCRNEKEQNANLDEVKHYAKLCKAFGTRYIRVFGGGIGKTDRAEAVEAAADTLKKMSAIAREYDITILVETHDDWTRCDDLRALLDRADCDNAAVLWDVHHPYRAVGESPQKTWEVLGKWIKYTHWKDSYLKEDGSLQLCMFGEGDIPLEEIYNVLKDNGYDGYMTLEWEKKWHPEIEEPEEAYPQYAKFMRNLMQG